LDRTWAQVKKKKFPPTIWGGIFREKIGKKKFGAGGGLVETTLDEGLINWGCLGEKNNDDN